MIEVGTLFDIGDVNTFVLAEVTDVLQHAFFAVPLRVVQLAAAMIDLVGIVVGDAFATKIVKNRLETSRDNLRTRHVEGVLKGFALIPFGDLGGECRGDQQERCSAQKNGFYQGGSFIYSRRAKNFEYEE
jgi:hypothetical protein